MKICPVKRTLNGCNFGHILPQRLSNYDFDQVLHLPGGPTKVKPTYIFVSKI